MTKDMTKHTLAVTLNNSSFLRIFSGPSGLPPLQWIAWKARNFTHILNTYISIVLVLGECEQHSRRHQRNIAHEELMKELLCCAFHNLSSPCYAMMQFQTGKNYAMHQICTHITSMNGGKLGEKKLCIYHYVKNLTSTQKNQLRTLVNTKKNQVEVHLCAQNSPSWV